MSVPALVPYDRITDDLVRRAKPADPTYDWRPNDRFAATLWVWDNGYGARNQPTHHVLRDMDTGRLYPVSGAELWEISRGVPTRLETQTGWVNKIVLLSADRHPGPPSEDFPLLPAYWGHSWSGDWIVIKHCHTYTIRLLRRQWYGPHGQPLPLPEVVAHV